MSMTECGVEPSMHERWLRAVIGADLPNESRATCANCAMCASGAGQPDLVGFLPDAKCCTYWPMLPNYLLGGILGSDGLDQAKAAIAQSIQSGSATPQGIGPTPAYDAVYASISADEFGRRTDLLCPYYERSTGQCGIWGFRNGVCGTWFCKFDRGAVGEAFWDSVGGLLAAVEGAVGLWCALQLGINPAAMLEQQSRQRNRQGPQGRRADGKTTGVAGTWGRWLGREAEFFRECYQLVNEMDWQAIGAIGGVNVDCRARDVKSRWLRLTREELPARLRLGRVNVLSASGDGIVLSSYRSSDVLHLKGELFDALRLFDGKRSTGEVADAAAGRGVELPNALLLWLLDQQILNESAAPEDPAVGAVLT
jgi:hypothetical protein